MTIAARLTPRRLDHPPDLSTGGWLTLHSALVPMVVWRRVGFLREFLRQLDVIERFLLTVAVELGYVNTTDFTELLGLPARMLPILAAGLVRAGALHRAEDGTYEETTMTAAALDRQYVAELRSFGQSIVFLPRTLDLLAVDDGRPTCLPAWMQDRRIAATAVAPVDVKFRGMRRNQYLDESLVAGGIAGLPPGIVAIDPNGSDADLIQGRPSANSPSEATTVLPLSCNAYRWTDITVRTTPDRGPRLTFTMHGKGVGRKAADRDYQPPRATFQIDGGSGLVSFWQDLLDEATGPGLRGIWSVVGPGTRGPLPDLELVDPGDWLFGLDVHTAEAIAAEGRSLIQPIGVRLDAEEAVLAVRIAFQPRGRAATELFAVDRAVRLVLSEPGPRLDDAVRQATLDLPAADAERVTADRVRGRLWQLRHFSYVYRLREAEDFRYDPDT